MILFFLYWMLMSRNTFGDWLSSKCRMFVEPWFIGDKTKSTAAETNQWEKIARSLISFWSLRGIWEI